MISRRGFLGAIAAALVADPERLLWVPRARLISVPAPRVHVDWAIMEESYFLPAAKEWQRRLNNWVTAQAEVIALAPQLTRVGPVKEALRLRRDDCNWVTKIGHPEISTRRALK